MILEDVVLLGRTVPSPSKKNGVSVCGVIYSPELQRLFRIYPLPVYGFDIKQRGIFRAELSRPSRANDSREESFKINNWTDIGKKAEKSQIRQIADKLSTSVDHLNGSRQSLGFLHPGEFSVEMRRKKENADFRQQLLFPETEYKDFKSGNDFPAIPVVNIPGNSQKKFQLRDWGIFELMRKNSKAVTSNYLQGIFKEKETFFLVGNHVANRTVWLIISFFSYRKQQQLSLF